MLKTRAVWVLALSLALLPLQPAHASNSGDFAGGVAIGTGYAGSVTAPTDGLVVQGVVGVGTASPAFTVDVNGTLNATSLLLNRIPMPLVPGGRLSLSSTSPVITSDITNATTIYYLPYVGQSIPIYNGTYWVQQDIGSSGISLALNTTNMPTTQVFDIYASMQSGNPILCALYWGGNTSRSSTAGGKSGTQDARIMQLNGIWTNKTAVAASNCYNGSTAYTFSANQGIYLGSFYTSAAGQTGVQCHAAAANGGPSGGAYIYIFNGYNRVPIVCGEQDSVQYTYSTSTYRQAHGSTNNQISFIDGLQQNSIFTVYTDSVANTTSAGLCYINSNLDSTTSLGVSQAYTSAPTNALGNNIGSMTTLYNGYPQLGYHYIAPIEYATNGTCNFNAGGNTYNFVLNWQY